MVSTSTMSEMYTPDRSNTHFDNKVGALLELQSVHLCDLGVVCWTADQQL